MDDSPYSIGQAMEEGNGEFAQHLSEEEGPLWRVSSALDKHSTATGQRKKPERPRKKAKTTVVEAPRNEEEVKMLERAGTALPRGRPRTTADFLDPPPFGELACALQESDGMVVPAEVGARFERLRKQKLEQKRNKEELQLQRNYVIASTLISRNRLEEGKARRLKEKSAAREQEIELMNKSSDRFVVRTLGSHRKLDLEQIPENLRATVQHRWGLIHGLASRKPHLSVEEKQAIRQLQYHCKNQTEIAELLGVSAMEVSRVLRGCDVIPESIKKTRGRHRKIEDRHVEAAAIFLFLANRKCYSHAVKFLREFYGIEISERTLSRRLKPMFGLRKSHFLTFPVQRNYESTIRLRQEWIRKVADPGYKGQRGLGFGFLNPEGTYEMKIETDLLFEALYLDEMIVRTVEKNTIWNVSGWRACDYLNPNESGKSVSLVFICCPATGFRRWMLNEGSTKAQTVSDFVRIVVSELAAERGEFLRQLKAIQNAGDKERLKEKKLEGELLTSSQRRALVLDNARVHSKDQLMQVLSEDQNQSYLAPEFLPPYSPFLNPCEEIFSHIRCETFRYMEQHLKVSNASIEVVKVAMNKVASTLDPAYFKKYLCHSREFHAMCRAGQPIHSEHHFEKTHIGEEGMTPEEAQNKLLSLVAECRKRDDNRKFSEASSSPAHQGEDSTS